MLESLVPSVREISADDLGIGVMAKATSHGDLRRRMPPKRTPTTQ